MKYDVIIVGGGIIGSSIAWQLSKEHAKVLVIERKDTASGACGATDGVVGYHTKKPGIQMELAKLSIDMFKTLHEELGEDVEYGFEAGGLQPVEDETQWEILSSIAEQQRASGVDIRMISGEEARKIEPNLAEDIYGALYSSTGGKVNPLKLSFAFAKAAKKNGAEFLYRTEVTDFIMEDNKVLGVKIASGEEFYAEKAVVNSCGAYAGRVAALAGLDLPINPRKGQLAVTEPIAPFMTAISDFRSTPQRELSTSPPFPNNQRFLNCNTE
jgi:sarcosine oxidase subunit beta